MTLGRMSDEKGNVIYACSHINVEEGQPQHPQSQSVVPVKRRRTTNNKGKVVLFHAPIGHFESYNTPTGILSVASYLQVKGYDVKYIDCSIETDYREMILSELDGALCVGVYAMSGHIKYLLPLLQEIKRVRPYLRVILGGPHATLFASQTAEDELIDFVVRGEGEGTLLELAEAFESNETDFSDIKGITYQQDGKIVSTPDRGFMDMDSLPFVDWSLMSPVALQSMSKQIGRVQSARGCPYRCTFCINVVSKNGAMRYRSPTVVVDEIERMKKDYGVHRIGFRDEIFLTDRQHVREIAEELIRRDLKITWLANPFPRFLRESWVDDEFLGLLARSGCTKLSCGAESGSARVLKMLQKPITPEDIVNFVRRAGKFNITSVVSFMTGLPGETEEEQLETLALIWKLLEIEPGTHINGPALWRPYPGGDLFDKAQELGLEIPKTFREWVDLETLGGLNPPWVKKVHFNQFEWFHVKHARAANLGQIEETFNDTGWFKSLLRTIYAKVSLFRLKHASYRFLLDFKLLHRAWWYTSDIPPNHS